MDHTDGSLNGVIVFPLGSLGVGPDLEWPTLKYQSSALEVNRAKSESPYEMLSEVDVKPPKAEVS